MQHQTVQLSPETDAFNARSPETSLKTQSECVTVLTYTVNPLAHQCHFLTPL